MAEAAGFVLIDGEMLVEQQQFPQRMNLALRVERGLIHLSQGVGLDCVDLINDPSDILVETWRHLSR